MSGLKKIAILAIGILSTGVVIAHGNHDEQSQSKEVILKDVAKDVGMVNGEKVAAQKGGSTMYAKLQKESYSHANMMAHKSMSEYQELLDSSPFYKMMDSEDKIALLEIHSKMLELHERSMKIMDKYNLNPEMSELKDSHYGEMDHGNKLNDHHIHDHND